MELTKLKRVANGDFRAEDFPKFTNGIQPYNPIQSIINFDELGQTKASPQINMPQITTQQLEEMGGGYAGLRKALDLDKAPEIPADFKPQIKLPQQSIANGKPAIATEQIGGIVPAAIGFGTDVYGATKYDKNQAELFSESNRSQQQIDGVGYEAYGGVNQSQFNKDVSSKKTANTLKTMGSGAALGAALGSVIPGLGTVFGGIAGGLIGGAAGFIAGGAMEKEAERRRRLANISGAIKTEDNRSDAATTALQLRANQNNQNPQAQLRGYALGIPYTGYEGLAMAGSGETITKGGQIIGRLPGKPTKKDNILIWVDRDTGIISNNVGKDGVRNSEWAYQHNDPIGGFIRDAESRAKNGAGYKNGKLPGFKEGYLGNLIPSGLGMLASVGQYLDASSQDLRSPQIYSANPYEQSALNDLAGLRINQYPIINQINNATARADYALNKSGGLSGYQRSRLRTANLYNTQKNISDTLMNAQMQNNQYRANLANAKMQLGSQYAQRMQQARMFNEEMLAKAHAARQQGKQMGMFNFLNQLQSYYANEFKRRQFNDTMDLYRQQQELDRDKLKMMFPDYDRVKPAITMNPLTNGQIKALGGLQLPYNSLAYTNDLYARMNAFKPKLIKR